MSDFLLLIHDFMKAAFVLGVLVLVATWPRRALAAGAKARLGSALLTAQVGASAACYAGSPKNEVASLDVDRDLPNKSQWAVGRISHLDTDEPAADCRRPGRVFRACDDLWMERNSFDPIANVDGTMMMDDDMDVNGNIFGMTESQFDSWDSNDMSSMFD